MQYILFIIRIKMVFFSDAKEAPPLLFVSSHDKCVVKKLVINVSVGLNWPIKIVTSPNLKFTNQ